MIRFALMAALLLLAIPGVSPAFASHTHSHSEHANQALGTDPRCTDATFAKHHPKLCTSAQASP